MAIETKDLTDEQLDYLVSSAEAMSYDDERLLIVGHLPYCMDSDAGGIVTALFLDGTTVDLTYDVIRENNPTFYIMKPVTFETLNNHEMTGGY